MRALFLLFIIMLPFFGFIAGAIYLYMQAAKAETEADKDPQLILRKLPSSTQMMLASLPQDKQMMFINEYKSQRKKKSSAYLSLPFFGSNYLYFGNMGMQFAKWASGFFFVFPFAIWQIYDLFTIPDQVKNYNDAVALNVINKLSIANQNQIAGGQMPQMASPHMQQAITAQQPPPPSPPKLEVADDIEDEPQARAA